MSEHPLELSARVIDGGLVDGRIEGETEPFRPNRVTQELCELADGVALVESFSHVVAVDTGDGLVTFDASGRRSGGEVVAALRRWSTEPVHSIVYTHGHLDHVGGSGAFAADAADRGHQQPRVVAHEAVATRLDRYELTAGYNQMINARQFGGAARSAAREQLGRHFVPPGTLRPDITYRDRLVETVGEVELHHQHCRGETDDHTWTWIPRHRMICAGDQFIWMFPNCGNPQKVQRYPLEWADSLRAMAATDVELFVPAHGLPIAGNERIRRCLDTVASTLETLVAEVLDAMNTGATLDEIVHSVRVDAEALALPYLRPLYDEPEFVIRNIWRLYGGWWDGNPARLKPPPDELVAVEVCRLAGGVEAVTDRAEEVSAAGDHRLACQLIEYAAAADPTSIVVHEARSRIYGARRVEETSLMAKGVYRSAQADSQAIVTGETPTASYVLDLN